MKKFLRGLGAVAALTAATGANAQLPDYGVYPSGHIITDIEGETHNIDDILNSGKAVIIDAFADWCPPCWTYHVGGTLDDVYNSIGDGGTGEVAIFGLEADPGEPEANISDPSTGQGDWTLGGDVHYPLADDDMIAGNINLAYYPTLVLVCPDRSTTEVGQVSQAGWEAAVAACPGLSPSTNDPRVLASTTASDLSVCGDGSASTEVKVVVQNYSSAPIDGTYTIEATMGADVIGSVDAALSLAAYEATEVSFGTIDFDAGANDITVTITTPNDDLTNDDINLTVNVNTAMDLGIGDLIVTSSFDAYGSEVGYGIYEGLPTTSDVFEAYPAMVGGTYPGEVAFYAIGTWADGDTGFEHAYPSLTAGCYHLFAVDNYGDGIVGGGWTIDSPNSSSTMTIDGDYGYGGPYLFEVTADGTGGFAGIEDADVVEFAEVYPNPTADVANIQFTLAESANVSIQLVNAVGQVVYNNVMGSVNGQQTVTVDGTDLEAGIYLVNITVDNNVITKRLSIVK